MRLEGFSGKKIALLGAGVENLALAPHLLEGDAIVTICDQGDEAAVRTRVGSLAVHLRTGSTYLDNLADFDVLFRIPGLPIARVQSALQNSTTKPLVTSAINLFLEICPAMIVGVTGTKGKGTTSTMIATLLRQSGKKVFVGANINEPVFGFIDEVTPEDVVVLELSSFQLEDVTHSPQVAVLVPITPDHLEPLSAQNPNSHASMEAYVAAKANLVAFQGPTDVLVFAADSDPVRNIAGDGLARKISVGSDQDADLRLNEDGTIYSGSEKMMELSSTGLRGQHIFLDAALAVAVAREFDVSLSQIQQGLSTYQPLPHRLQTVATKGGVLFVDDSYATAPDATIAALTAFHQPIIWIGGGSSKGVSFTGLAQAAARSSMTKALLIGQEAPRIAEAFKQHAANVPTTIVQSLDAAVAEAVAAAKSGSVVLLSPACASKDMFLHAADRGEQFQERVHALQL
jgi:UDP-N-acetylmuramoylalanine--D-glutamate ligase